MPLIAALVLQQRIVNAQTRPDGAASVAPPKPGSGDGASDLDTSAAFERARSFYQIGSYDQCAEAYAALLPEVMPAASRGQPLEQARVTYSACLLALGKRDDADRQLRAAMKENPLMASPDPVVFPAQVRDLFFQVKSDFLEEVRQAQDEQLRQAREIEAQKAERLRLERLRIAALERMASQETLVHENRRWIAAVPFGVGQFQNGQNSLGALFLTTEAALLAATIGAAAWQLRIHNNADGGHNVAQPEVFNTPLQVAYRVQLWAGAGFILLTAVGILEAQLSFVPEVTLSTRTRKAPLALPPTPRPAPSGPALSPVQGGAVVGWSGRF